MTLTAYFLVYLAFLSGEASTEFAADVMEEWPESGAEPGARNLRLMVDLSVAISRALTYNKHRALIG